MYLVVIIMGLITGSFLNAVIFRLNQKTSFVKGRSKCMSCKHELGVLDLIPVFSWLFLRGKCRYCKKKIDWQYPVVELGTAVLFVWALIETMHASSVQTIFYFIIIAFLIIIFVYDLRYQLILDRVSLPAIVIALLGNLYLGEIWWSLLLGAGIGGGIFLLQFVVSRGKWVGGGDIRLGVLMGVLLGWEKTLVALFLAYVMGALVGVILIIKKKKQMGEAIAFGTFLVVGTLIALFYGDVIIDWYLNIILF